MLLRLILSLVIVLTVAMAGVAHAKIYKWVDESGKTHISDKPPRSGGFDEVNIKVNVISTSKPSPTDRTSDGRSQAAASVKQVIMYGAEWCGVCKQAKQYFKANGIPFKEYDIDKSRKGRLEYDKLGGRGVPLILVGKERMDGFSAATFQHLYSKP